MPRPKRKAVENSEVKAKRAKGETDLEGNLKWSYHGPVGKNAPYIQPLLQLTSDSLPGCSKAVGFDIDYTLIEPKSGRRFATGKYTHVLIRVLISKKCLYFCSHLFIIKHFCTWSVTMNIIWSHQVLHSLATGRCQSTQIVS